MQKALWDEQKEELKISYDERHKTSIVPQKIVDKFALYAIKMQQLRNEFLNSTAMWW